MAFVMAETPAGAQGIPAEDVWAEWARTEIATLRAERDELRVIATGIRQGLLAEEADAMEPACPACRAHHRLHEARTNNDPVMAETPVGHVHDGECDALTCPNPPPTPPRKQSIEQATIAVHLAEIAALRAEIEQLNAERGQWAVPLRKEIDAHERTIATLRADIQHLSESYDRQTANMRHHIARAEALTAVLEQIRTEVPARFRTLVEAALQQGTEV